MVFQEGEEKRERNDKIRRRSVDALRDAAEILERIAPEWIDD